MPCVAEERHRGADEVALVAGEVNDGNSRKVGGEYAAKIGEGKI